MNILVTGGAGYTGSHTVRELINSGGLKEIMQTAWRRRLTLPRGFKR